MINTAENFRTCFSSLTVCEIMFECDFCSCLLKLPNFDNILVLEIYQGEH